MLCGVRWTDPKVFYAKCRYFVYVFRGSVSSSTHLRRNTAAANINCKCQCLWLYSFISDGAHDFRVAERPVCVCVWTNISQRVCFFYFFLLRVIIERVVAVDRRLLWVIKTLRLHPLTWNAEHQNTQSVSLEVRIIGFHPCFICTWPGHGDRIHFSRPEYFGQSDESSDMKRYIRQLFDVRTD